MPDVVLNSNIFDAIESAAALPDTTLDFAADLETLSMGDTVSDPTVLQLSSSLIRISQDLWQYSSGGWTPVTYELRASGSGISPVGSMAGLLDAINNGLAAGTLSKFSILTGGVEVLSLTLGAAGYVLQSGAQSLTLSGHLPLTFAQFYDLAGLVDQAFNIDFLTQSERLALFDDLTAYSITGITVKDGADTLFAASVTATTASITLNGLTISLKGTFPDNLGEDLSLLWDAASTFRQTGDLAALAIFTSADLSVTSLTITSAAGKVLASVNDPLADTPVTWVMNGKAMDEVLMGDMDNDVISGSGGLANSVLAGLWGSDQLNGYAGSDRLYGGLNNDLLFGGKGSDYLDGGGGRDSFTGGSGRDVFVFNPGDGIDRITDFAEGIDHIRIESANRLGNLTFTRVGSDVQIDFGTIHILVEDTTIAQLRQIENFQF
jgi:Ca2+-binding RTX toxin-like protein